MTHPKLITLEQLIANDACSESLAKFEALFGDSVVLTREFVEEHYIEALAQAEYDHTMQVAKAKYNRAVNAARVKYARVEVPIQTGRVFAKVLTFFDRYVAP